jgi:hypothetical protein
MGWDYEVVGAPPGTLLGNVRWLAGYRIRATSCPASRPRCARRSPSLAS